MNARTWIVRIGGGLAALLIVAQAVPYGRDHANPPVRAEPAWDSPKTAELFARACADCHTNETEWPWYSNVAPVSWLVQHDVEEGRAEFNASEMDRPQKEAHEAAEVVAEGEMPMPIYAWMHGHARLTDAERSALVAGLRATFGGEEARDG